MHRMERGARDTMLAMLPPVAVVLVERWFVAGLVKTAK